MTRTAKSLVVTAAAVAALGTAALPAAADNHTPAPPQSATTLDNHAPVPPADKHTPLTALDKHMPLTPLDNHIP
ncbi:hypothetical protein [Streptomyces lydicus]|uniref:hypothetical protein n=1 Tax=Streptomyces lydicus TaxID=47763 RepID=UPI0037A8D3D2